MNRRIGGAASGVLDRLSGFGQPLAEFWAARDARERKLLSVGIAVVLFGLVYGLLIDPALSGSEQLNKNLPVLRQQSAQLQALAREASSLTAQAPAMVAPLAKEELDRTLSARGLKAESVAVSGEIAKVQLSAVSFAGLLQWLDEIQKTALVSVSDANIVALPQSDTVNATLTLRQIKNE